MRTILVPTDFSKNANNALRFAINLAKKGEMKIILLNAYSIPPGNMVPLSTDTKELEVAGKLASDQLRGLCVEVILSEKVKCEYLGWNGKPVEAILDCVKRKGIDLVVMGTKGASGLKETFIGSNTADVVEKAICPVIVIPESAALYEIKKMIYVTDYLNSDMIALKEVVEIAKLFNAHIDVIHVCDGEFTPFSEKTLMKAFRGKFSKRSRYKNIAYHLTYSDNIVNKLEEFASSKSTGVLAMATHYRSFMDRLLSKSITRKMAYHTKVPLITFHYKKEPTVLV